jgi:hypothetical protein
VKVWAGRSSTDQPCLAKAWSSQSILFSVVTNGEYEIISALESTGKFEVGMSTKASRLGLDGQRRERRPATFSVVA